MFISPMLLHRVDDPFSDYLTELKLDGIRLIWSNINGVVKIYTRHKTDVTNRFPELYSLPLPHGTVLFLMVRSLLLIPLENPTLKPCNPDFYVPRIKKTSKTSHTVYLMLFIMPTKVSHTYLLLNVNDIKFTYPYRQRITI